MSRLFINLYLDEDVDVLIADLLRAYGYSVTTTAADGRLGTSDAEQLEYAAAQGMAILTDNRVDFEGLFQDYLTTGRSHAGILVAVRRLPHDILRRLLLVLNQVTADEMANQVRYIQSSEHYSVQNR